MREKIKAIIAECEDEYYAQETASPEQITGQILNEIYCEIEKVENLSSIHSHSQEYWKHQGFEECRQKILNLFKEEK